MLTELEWGHFQLQMLPEIKSRMKMFKKFILLHVFQMYQLDIAARVIREAKF